MRVILTWWERLFPKGGELRWFEQPLITSAGCVSREWLHDLERMHKRGGW